MNLFKKCFIRLEIKKQKLMSILSLLIKIVERGVSVVIGEYYDLKKIRNTIFHIYKYRGYTQQLKISPINLRLFFIASQKV